MRKKPRNTWHKNFKNFVHKIFISMLELSYISLSYFVLLNQSHTKKKWKKNKTEESKSEKHEKLLWLGKLYTMKDRRTSSHANEKLFNLSIAHDTREIPFECLENRSRTKKKSKFIVMRNSVNTEGSARPQPHTKCLCKLIEIYTNICGGSQKKQKSN